MDPGDAAARRRARTRSRSSRTGSRPPSGATRCIVDRGAGRPTPNVLFVVIDTLRVDALPAMPRLRALAGRRRVVHAGDHGGHLDATVGAGDARRRSADGARPGRRGDDPVRRGSTPLLRDRAAAVAAACSLARGYRSVAIGNNFFLLGYPQIGLTLGFEEVADIRHPVLDTPAITQRRGRVHRGPPRRAVAPAPALRRAALAVHAAAGVPGEGAGDAVSRRPDGPRISRRGGVRRRLPRARHRHARSTEAVGAHARRRRRRSRRDVRPRALLHRRGACINRRCTITAGRATTSCCACRSSMRMPGTVPEDDDRRSR